MNRVHDLDGDLFAMPPGPLFGKPHIWNPPAVGDVIANTRTDEMWGQGSEPRLEQRTVWADPPFLRVTDVLPIQTDDPNLVGTVWARNDGTFWLIVEAGDDVEGLPLDLPEAVPGGWAIRVEPHTPTQGPPHELDAPPPTGTPLNTKD